MEETVALLAARAPRLRKAARDAARAVHAYVVLDGTLIPIDRVAADRPFYSGKHKRHGMNLQVIAERANAQLKTWKILTKLRCCPWRAGQLSQGHPRTAATRNITRMEKGSVSCPGRKFSRVLNKPRPFAVQIRHFLKYLSQFNFPDYPSLCS